MRNATTHDAMVFIDTKASIDTIVQWTRRYVVGCNSLRALCIDGIESHARQDSP
jgi:hypothetical protein